MVIQRSLSDMDFIMDMETNLPSFPSSAASTSSSTLSDARSAAPDFSYSIKFVLNTTGVCMKPGRYYPRNGPCLTLFGQCLAMKLFSTAF
jgi:hypothetical protein